MSEHSDPSAVDPSNAPPPSTLSRGDEVPAELDHGQAEVQERSDEGTNKGFHGVKVDPTPNEHYTFPGQASGLPTPETHDDQAAEAVAHARRVSRGEVEA